MVVVVMVERKVKSMQLNGIVLSLFRWANGLKGGVRPTRSLFFSPSFVDLTLGVVPLLPLSKPFLC